MFKSPLKASGASSQFDKSDYLEIFINNEKENLFYGSFDSFEAAQDAAPKGKHVGYDGASDVGTMYSPQICTWDYPPIFWLAEAFRNGATSVFDLGGHVGIKYYAFRRVVGYPGSLRWTVCDVPSVAAAGEALAIDRNAHSELSFCTDLKGASGTDVLMLSGSLQYLPLRLAEILSALAQKPKRVILNITAAHSTRTLFTLNSIGSAVCPYRVQFQDEILNELRQAGYRRRDVWRNDGKPIVIPFVEGGEDAFYFGCCFDLAREDVQP